LNNESWLTPRDALEMATVNGAAALGQRDRLGCLRPGAFADMIALPISGKDVFQGIVEFDAKVPWMMLNGQIRENAE